LLYARRDRPFGALLAQGAAVLDCCDGEVARAKFLQSRAGYWLDVVSDTVVHIALFLGIGVAVWWSASCEKMYRQPSCHTVFWPEKKAGREPIPAFRREEIKH
jgi:hypothetical protein